ncbi:hypothetical protein JCM5353_008231 [Sporobolomyces roseus]
MSSSNTNASQTVPHFDPSAAQPFSSLQELVAAEEEDSKRIRPSATDWWVDAIRIKGSTIPRVWKAVTICTLWSILVAVLDLIYDLDVGLTKSVTPMLSIVVGLILVFRNTSAYNRWDTGRTTFAKMISTTRSLSRVIWIYVGAPTSEQSRIDAQGKVKELSAKETGEREKDLEDKKKCLRLLVAFVIATKHHVRGEYGTHWPDLETTLPPRFKEFARSAAFDKATVHRTASDNDALPECTESVAAEIHRLARTTSVSSERMPPDLEAQSLTSADGELSPLLRNHKTKDNPTTDKSRAVFKSYLAKPSLPLPLVIAHQLSVYLATCKRRGQLESIGPAGYANLVLAINTLIECFTSCERLATVGIPNVYAIHLKQVVTIYLFTLPPILVEQMGFFMIPFCTCVAFMIIGIEGISSAMEMPFGADDSDLPLDLFCAELRNEVEHKIACLPRGSEEFCL